jgi:hypothetical protein
MKQIVRHEVTQAQAKQAIDTAIQVYSRKFPKYQPRTNWLTDSHAQVSFHVKGMSLTANIKTLADRIEMDMDVPFVFWPIKGQAMRLIEGEIRKWLARAKAGELKKV